MICSFGTTIKIKYWATPRDMSVATAKTGKSVDIIVVARLYQPLVIGDN